MIPSYMIEDRTVSFNPSDVLFIDRKSGIVLKASPVNAEVSMTSNIYGCNRWVIQFEGEGTLKIARMTDFDIDEQDIINLVNDTL